MRIQRTDILSSETLDNKHHHVLFPHRHAISLCLMNRRINPVKFLIAKVTWILERMLTHSANKRERSVKHNGCLLWMRHILIGITNGYRAYSRGKSSSHSCYAERNEHDKSKNIPDITSPFSPTIFENQLRAIPQNHDKHHSERNEIPMSQNFYSKNTANVILILKLLNN